MRDPKNIRDIALLKPDYMGFIFYSSSPRYVGVDFEIESDLSSEIKRVGVFVNETRDSILKTVKKYKLDFIQLHGSETSEFCKEIKDTGLSVIKTFGVDRTFDFNNLKPYKKNCDYFLFDAKTLIHGGSGKKFDWNILSMYDQEKPVFLSGGITSGDTELIHALQKMNIHAIDINSKFEITPAIKDVDRVRNFIKKIRT